MHVKNNINKHKKNVTRYKNYEYDINEIIIFNSFL